MPQWQRLQVLFYTTFSSAAFVVASLPAANKGRHSFVVQLAPRLQFDST
jgi:hypothetical protein